MIEEWKGKREYLVEERVPREVSRSRLPDHLRGKVVRIESVTKLAEALRLSRQQLYDVTDDIEDRIRAGIGWLYGIPDKSECMGEFNSGSLADFKDEFEKLHPAISGRTGGDHSDTRLPGLALSVLTRAELEGMNPWAVLASLDFSGEQRPGGEPFALSIRLNCHTDDLGYGVTVGLVSARLTVEAGEAEAREKLGADEPLVIERGGGTVRITPIMLDVSGVWDIRAEVGWIGAIVRNEPFCRLMGLIPGTRIRARLAAYVRDLKPVASDEEVVGTGFSTSFKLLGDANLNAARKRILERLALLPITDPFDVPGRVWDDHQPICDVTRTVISTGEELAESK